MAEDAPDKRDERNSSTQKQMRYDELFQLASEEATRYVQDLTRITINYYSSLASLNRQFNERFFSLMTQQPVPDTQFDKDDASPQMDVVLSGPLGSELVGVFAIENNRNELMNISFTVTEFTETGDTSAFRPPLRIEPSRFTLQPAEEREVKLILPLTSDFFEAGKTYQSAITVNGYDNLIMWLTVHVEDQSAGIETP